MQQSHDKLQDSIHHQNTRQITLSNVYITKLITSVAAQMFNFAKLVNVNP